MTSQQKLERNIRALLPTCLEHPSSDIYLSDNYVTLDFETTNHDKGDPVNKNNSIVLAVWKYKGRYKKIRGSEYDMAPLIRDIQEADYLLCHNTKFELGWLLRCGLDISAVTIADTMLAEYVLLGNKKLPKDLGSIAERYGYPGKEPYVEKCIKLGVCPSTIPASMLDKRCCYDVWVTDEVWKAQRERLVERVLLPVLLTRCIFTPVLADIERRGLCLDKERVYEEYRKESERFEELSARMSEISGGINPRSSVQMGEFIYDKLGFEELRGRDRKPIRTGNDKRKTDEATLGRLKCRNKAQREFIQLRKELASCSSALSKTLENLKNCIDNKDLLYASFNQSVTSTHRLSSSGKRYGVQFQNFPRAYKRLFTTRNDSNILCEIDGSQLEFRVAAYLGKDGKAIEDIQTGTDVHQYTADTITASGQDTTRQEAKSHTFKPLYGGTSGTKAEQAYYEAFKQKYQGIANAQQTWCITAGAEKKLTAETGLTFYFPDAKIRADGYVTGSTKICNYPVQNLATAEIIPIAITCLWHLMQALNLKSFMVNTVHDSVILEIVPEELDIIRELGLFAFTEYVYDYLWMVYRIEFSVPLGIGFTCGTHWGTGEEEKYSVDPPKRG